MIERKRKEPEIKIPQSKRWRLAVGTMVIMILIGILAFIFDPEYLDELGSYMVVSVVPIIGYLLAETWRGSGHQHHGFGGYNHYNRYDRYNIRDNNNNHYDNNNMDSPDDDPEQNP